ncbi:MAG: hypothetical protein K9M45_07995 [Kiritimatiellales bacterium]|nr:hypothetical protein [Kiritimatiellales bacterium]
MNSLKKKKNIANSKAILFSIGIHVLILLIAGNIVAIRLYKKYREGVKFESTERPKLELRKLDMQVNIQKPLMERMNRPKMKHTSRITARGKQEFNLPMAETYSRQLAPPTFKGDFVNDASLGSLMELTSKFREITFGVSEVEFFGIKDKGEKIVYVVDASKTMLHDRRGGATSYQILKDSFRDMISTMKSATLFNVILYDGDRVATFSPKLTAATAGNKDKVLEWFAPINTISNNFSVIGIPEEMVNYKQTVKYDRPIKDEDVVGWLKGLQAAIELKPEAIFLLGAEWGNQTTAKMEISYFMNKEKFPEYQAFWASTYLEDDDKEELAEYLDEFAMIRKIALQMMELENNARLEQGLPPKIAHDWDDILIENEIEIPEPPRSSDYEIADIIPADTRHETEDILESLFVVAMENYRQLGFPRISYVLFVAENIQRNTEQAAANLTADAKFKALAKFCRGRFTLLVGEDEVQNLLNQDLRDFEEYREWK